MSLKVYRLNNPLLQHQNQWERSFSLHIDFLCDLKALISDHLQVLNMFFLNFVGKCFSFYFTIISENKRPFFPIKLWNFCLFADTMTWHLENVHSSQLFKSRKQNSLPSCSSGAASLPPVLWKESFDFLQSESLMLKHKRREWEHLVWSCSPVGWEKATGRDS